MNVAHLHAAPRARRRVTARGVRRRAARRPRGYVTPGVRGVTAVLMTLGMAVVAFSMGFAAHGVIDAVAPAATARPFAAPVAESPPSPLPESAPVADVVEGHDYAFFARSGTEPVRWPCGEEITIALTGSTPDAAAAALAEVTQVLRMASGLDLALLEHDAPADITVAYGPLGAAYGDLVLDAESTLGTGGGSWTTPRGIFTSGVVLVRDDAPLADPATATGRRVLMHELAHALGLGHASPDAAELMAPSTRAGDEAQLGDGDTVALRAIGCPS